MIRRNLTLLLLTLCACLGFSFIAIKVSQSALANSNPHPVEINQPIENQTATSTTISEENSDSKSVQVALILDTSNSMDGLIEQAKSQLWNILNELARTKKDDQETDLEVALYEYGNSGYIDKGIEIRQLSGFTQDMDLISEKLFSLKTNGGEEYCGAVIKRSLEELTWNDGNTLKLIYIAGNEPFNQGPVDYGKVCRTASQNGIVVNTIFCGVQSEGVRGQWNYGASLGGGEFMSISQDEVTTYISTPYDDELAKLNLQLNETYIPFGEKGYHMKQNLILQDANAESYSKANAADRISFKSSKKYKSDDWDLIEAYKKDKSILGKAKIKDEKYSSMSIEELESNIELVTEERESVKKQIKELDKKRRMYKEEQLKKNNKDKSNSLQESIIKSVKKQAEKKGYKIEG